MSYKNVSHVINLFYKSEWFFYIKLPTETEEVAFLFKFFQV